MNRPYYLIGAGGTGSLLYLPLLSYLTAAYSHLDESFTLTVLDGKAIAASKLDRQMFFGRYVGENKATSLVAQYESDNDRVTAIADYLNGDNINAIRTRSIILIAADNFPVRARLEAHCLKLNNATIINGGNELFDGSMQIFARRHGKNITPPLSQGHPELLVPATDDPAELSCDQVAALPSGGQTLAANMMSATAMLNALHHLLQWEATYDESTDVVLPEEVFFDLRTFAMRNVPRPEAT